MLDLIIDIVLVKQKLAPLCRAELNGLARPVAIAAVRCEATTDESHFR